MGRRVGQKGRSGRGGVVVRVSVVGVDVHYALQAELRIAIQEESSRKDELDKAQAEKNEALQRLGVYEQEAESLLL